MLNWNINRVLLFFSYLGEGHGAEQTHIRALKSLLESSPQNALLKLGWDHERGDTWVTPEHETVSYASDRVVIPSHHHGPNNSLAEMVRRSSAFYLMSNLSLQGLGKPSKQFLSLVSQTQSQHCEATELHLITVHKLTLQNWAYPEFKQWTSGVNIVITTGTKKEHAEIMTNRLIPLICRENELRDLLYREISSRNLVSSILQSKKCTEWRM